MSPHNLHREFKISVHDYGGSEYKVNGTHPPSEQEITNTNDSESLRFNSFTNVDEMLKVFPENFFDNRPEWAKVRWIDVEGLNKELVLFLLKCLNIDKQFTYRNIMEVKQRSMAIVLDDFTDTEQDSNILNFLLVSKVPKLSDSALYKLRNDQELLYELNRKQKMTKINNNLPNKNANETSKKQLFDLVEYEKISYLMSMEIATNTGTLISFEESKLV